MARGRIIGTIPLILLGLVLLMGAAGCSSSGSAPKTPLIPTPTATVIMHWHSFEPASITIQQGQTVQWHNSTIVSHTVTCDPSLAKKAEDVMLPTGATAFDSGKVSDDWQYTFNVPGTYKYICIPHETMGMIGQVTVQPTTKP